MKTTKLQLTIICCLFIVLLAAGCGSSKETAPPETTPQPTPAPGEAASANADAIYKQNCLSCHGEDLSGQIPGNTNLQTVGSRLSREEIYNRIHNGGNGMPAFNGRLSEEEINALADWLAAKK